MGHPLDGLTMAQKIQKTKEKLEEGRQTLQTEARLIRLAEFGLKELPLERDFWNHQNDLLKHKQGELKSLEEIFETISKIEEFEIISKMEENENKPDSA